MKNIVIIGLCLSLLSVTIMDIVVFADYVVNRDFIVENFCVNKDQVEMQCNGKCALSKRIQNNHQENKETPYKSFDNKLRINFILVAKTQVEHLFSMDVMNIPNYERNLHHKRYTKLIFQPPRLA